MSMHSKQVESHQVHQALDSVCNSLVAAKDVKEIPLDVVEIIQRAEFIVNNFTEALYQANKSLVAVAWLDEVLNALSNIKSNLTSYINSGNVAYIKAGIDHQLELLLNNTVKINTIRSKSNLQGIMSSIDKYQNSISDYLDALRKQKDQLESEKESLSKEIASLSIEIQNRSSEFENTVSKQQQRLDNLITNHQNQMAENKSEFQSQQKYFSDDFDIKQKESKIAFEAQQKEFSLQVERMVNAFDDKVVDFESETFTLIDEKKGVFKAYQDEVKNIVGIVNTNMFSHKYKEVADNAYGRAKFWHRTTIGLIVVLAIFALYSFALTLTQDTTWVQLTARIFAATTIATGAAYAARQASKQEKVERYARKIEMEMVSIDPFLESLPEPQQQEIKQEIARSIFGKSDSMEITDKDDAHNVLDKRANAEEILSAITKLIGKIS